MKKIEYIESIKYRLKSINETSRYDDRLIELAIARVYQDYLFRLYNESDPMDKFTKPYDVKLKEEDGEYYFDLPVSPIDLTGKNEGVYYVRTKAGKKLSPLTSIATEIFDSLGVNDVDYRSTYYVGSDKVYVQLYEDALGYPENLVVGIIRNFNDYGKEEYVPMPKQVSGRIATEVVTFLANEAPMDMIGDNSDNLKPNTVPNE